jgi:hypothetical protein
MPPTRRNGPSLRTIRRLSAVCQARGPGARSSPTAATCAVSHPALFRVPPVPGPFATAGRAIHRRDRMFDPDHPGHPALRAAGRHAGRHRLGPDARASHPAPVPRPARRRAEHRRGSQIRHQRLTAPTAQPRPGTVVLDRDQPQPGRPAPTHAATVRLVDPDRDKFLGIRRGAG